MSDTITCPNCTATLPAAASFCTSCGNRLGSAPPAAAPAGGPAGGPPDSFAPPPAPAGPVSFAPPVDPTRVDGPPLSDPTEVYRVPSAAPPPPAPASAPWQPDPAGSAGAWNAPPPATAATPAAYGAPAAPPTTATGQTPAWSPTSWDSPAAPGGQATKAELPGSPLGAALAILGGILTLVGIFMPWVKSNISDAGLSGWDLTSGDKGFRLPDGALLTFESLDPYAVLALGVGALVAGVLAFKGSSRNLSRVLAVVLGVGIIAYLIRDWTSLASVVETRAPASFEVSSDIGFYLTIAGGALVVISALMPSQAKKQ